MEILTVWLAIKHTFLFVLKYFDDNKHAWCNQQKQKIAI